MNRTKEQIAALERANYAATLATAQATPGLDLTMREDVIITSSEAFPLPDLNHACLLRASAQAVETLISEVIDCFQSNGLPTTVFVSPACTPTDLPDRLVQRGFVKQDEEEAWLVIDRLVDYATPLPPSNVEVAQIDSDGALAFAEVFMEAFEMPTDFAPYMAQLVAPSVNLPGVHHYLASLEGQQVGTCSLLCHGGFGVLGSAGVVPASRRCGVATSLAVQAITEAQQQGVETLILQTTAGTPLERLLRISGFVRAFSRSCFVLP